MTLNEEIAVERKRLRLTRPEPMESQVLRSVLHALRLHPKVARAWRNNTGGAYLAARNGGKQFVQFGFKGAPDICGFLKGSGRALFIECKRPSTKPSSEQQSFLDEASRAGCVAFVARDISDVFTALDAA